MKLAIEGMHCEACVRRVEKVLSKVDGARVEKVEIGSATVWIDPTHEQAVLDAVQKSGYSARKSE